MDLHQGNYFTHLNKMENPSQAMRSKKEKPTFVKKFKKSFFAIVFHLLKNKQIGKYDLQFARVAVSLYLHIHHVFLSLCFSLPKRRNLISQKLQLFQWNDTLLLSLFQSFADYVGIVAAIENSQSQIYYQLFFFFGKTSLIKQFTAIAYLLIKLLLLVYLHYALKNPNVYFESLVQFLKALQLSTYFVLFMPFYEIFISVFRCEKQSNGTTTHFILVDLQCYQGQHLALVIQSVISIIALIGNNILICLLYNETQPIKEDALSRLDSNFEILMLLYRILIGTLSQFCTYSYCSWIAIAVSVVSSIYFTHQYFKYLPYYNSLVSVFFGSMVGIYCWITLNCIFSQFYHINGNIIIILCGCPMVSYLVKSYREVKIEWLMTQATENMTSDIDSLNQITMVQRSLEDSVKTSDINRDMRIKGLINLHLQECQVDDCICKHLEELFDIQNDCYLQPSQVQDLHANDIFINHFNKQIYSEALNKFINSPSIHISFAFFYFSVMKNVHAALHELKIASKKRPSLQQQFTIFRYQNIIEVYIQKEHDAKKHIYEQLTNVKEFERLFQDMQKQIEKVCNFQVEFWTHLTTVVPDLNHLNELNLKIWKAAQETDFLWESLTRINNNYPQALTLYGEYLTFIRNNQQAGKEHFDKAHNVDIVQKSVQEHIKRSDVLFTEDTTVIHISGVRESSGRILKVSQGLFKCFGLSKQEVVGHNVNLLMPTLFSERHNEFMDAYYRTGRKTIFNRERQLFGLNRQGYCFTMKILIKQMPSLKEDIQYVGMVRPISTDYEYILTDMQGNIDSFTNGVGSMFNLNPQLFKDQLSINIQLLAPELIQIFEFRRPGGNNQQLVEKEQDANYRNYYRRSSFSTFQYGTSKFISNNKFSVPGGDQLTFMIPNNFAQIIKSEKPTKSNRANAKKKGDEQASIQHGPPQNNSNKFLKSAPFREFLKYLSKGRNYAKKAPDFKKLIQCKEYRDCDMKKVISIEIREWFIPLGNNTDRGLKMLLFMVPKNQSEKKGQDLQSFDRPAAQVGQQQAANPPNVDESQVNISQAQPQNTVVPKPKIGPLSTFGEKKIVLPPNNQHFPMAQSFQSSGLSSKIQNQLMNGQLQQAVSFLDNDNYVAPQDPLTPIREESSPSPEPKKGKGPLKQDLELGLKITKIGGAPLDISDLQQIDTDEQEEDNEHEIDTDRIDVKKEIALNDEIKQTTKSFEENNLLSDSKLSMQSKPYGQGSGSQIQNSGKVGKTEDAKNQVVNKPMMERISQSKDEGDDEGAEDEDDFDDEDNEEDDEFEGNDEDSEDDMESHQNKEDSKIDLDQSPENSEDELIPDKRYPKKKMSNSKGGGSSSHNKGATATDWSKAQKEAHQQFEAMTPQNQNVHQEKKHKIHDFTRIVTNPRYKYFDDETCGSAYFNDCNVSERELDIREAIKKYEASKKRRERRRLKKKEEEEKKQLELNTDKKDEETKGKSDDKDTKQEEENKSRKSSRRKKRGEDESESKSKSRGGKSDSSHPSDEEKKADDDEEEKLNYEKDQDQPQNDEGEISSIASSQQSQTRTYFTLRAAIDEKFVPQSIKNLRFVANLVSLLILLLSIVYFAIQVTLFSSIQNYIDIIINAQNRDTDIGYMNLKLNDLQILNEGYLQPQNYIIPNQTTLVQTYKSYLVNYTIDLKTAQTSLSEQSVSLPSSAQSQINPTNVVLQFPQVPNLPSNYTFDIWEAIMQIVVVTLEIADTPLQIIASNPSVQFVMNNCMNSVSLALGSSTNAVINESNAERQTNINIFMYLLLAVSFALLLSVAFLLPVIRRAKYSKQDVFELFTHRKVEKIIDEQLKKCRWFITKFQAQAENQNFEQDLQDNMIEDHTHIPEKEMKSDDDKSSEYMKNYKKQKKKWKKIDINFGSLMLKFSILLLLIESFFCFNYLISKQKLNEVQNLTNELRLLISRQPALIYTILMEKALFFSNNTAQFEFQPVQTVVYDSYQTQSNDYQELLLVFSQNYGYHSSTYNTYFQNLIYSNICDQLEFYTTSVNANGNINKTNIDNSTCQAFNGGILQKGIYNSVVKLWTQLQQLHNDFFGSNRTVSDIQQFLNNPRLVLNQEMTEQYLDPSHQFLAQILRNDINAFFQQSFQIYEAAFIVFIFYVLFIYFFVWKIFMRNLMKEQWKAKSVLSVLPVEICFRIEEIRSFIYRNSSTFMGAKG